MSSFRNSLHRRNHKERSQLSHRSRLGILEKHKDYVKRARDFHSKKDRIQRLKEKAAGRNKDEFYFGMVKSRTEVSCFLYPTRLISFFWRFVGRGTRSGQRERIAANRYGESPQITRWKLYPSRSPSWAKGALPHAVV